MALLVGRRWACGGVVPTKRSGASAEKMPRSICRNSCPPESRKQQGRNASIFQLCRAEPVGRAANFRANFHGAAAKLNAPQAFNAPTCHGNSWNASFNVLPRIVPIRAEPSAAPLYSQNATLFLSSRRKSAKTAGTLNVLPRIVPIRAEPSAAPHTRRTPRFSSLRGEKRENSRNAQRSPSHRSNPRRTSAVPYTRRTPRFSSLRGEKARKQPERSTFSLAAFQSTQNLRRPPILAERHAFLSSRRKARKQPERQFQRSPPPRSNPRRTIRRSLRLHYLTFHKRQGHAKERQL